MNSNEFFCNYWIDNETILNKKLVENVSLYIKGIFRFITKKHLQIHSQHNQY